MNVCRLFLWIFEDATLALSCLHSPLCSSVQPEVAGAYLLYHPLSFEFVSYALHTSKFLYFNSSAIPVWTKQRFSRRRGRATCTRLPANCNLVFTMLSPTLKSWLMIGFLVVFFAEKIWMSKNHFLETVTGEL